MDKIVAAAEGNVRGKGKAAASHAREADRHRRELETALVPVAREAQNRLPARVVAQCRHCIVPAGVADDEFAGN
jgi:hypothetical protein